MELVIIASGPSSERAVIPDGAKVACVNESYKRISPRIPDYWMCAEHNAAYAYTKTAKQFAEAGCVNLSRPSAKRRGVHEAIVIPHGYGPRGLRHLHGDVPGLPLRDDDPSGGKWRPWMTGGVLLLWYALEALKPSKITVYGIDGYPSAYEQRAKGQREYAEGLDGLPNRPLRDDAWCEQSNWWVDCCINALTHYYTEPRIEWGVRPRNFPACGNWRVHWNALASKEAA